MHVYILYILYNFSINDTALHALIMILSKKIQQCNFYQIITPHCIYNSVNNIVAPVIFLFRYIQAKKISHRGAPNGHGLRPCRRRSFNGPFHGR